MHVDPSGLLILSSTCQTQAAAVGAGVAAAPVGDSFPATATAIAAVHASVARASQQIAGRLQSTAEEASSAAGGYARTEFANAESLTFPEIVEV
jgi:hypothetical protein